MSTDDSIAAGAVTAVPPVNRVAERHKTRVAPIGGHGHHPQRQGHDRQSQDAEGFSFSPDMSKEAADLLLMALPADIPEPSSDTPVTLGHLKRALVTRKEGRTLRAGREQAELAALRAASDLLYPENGTFYPWADTFVTIAHENHAVVDRYAVRA